jgi:hypothetical protein
LSNSLLWSNNINTLQSYLTLTLIEIRQTLRFWITLDPDCIRKTLQSGLILHSHWARQTLQFCMVFNTDWIRKTFLSWLSLICYWIRQTLLFCPQLLGRIFLFFTLSSNFGIQVYQQVAYEKWTDMELCQGDNIPSPK